MDLGIQRYDRVLTRNQSLLFDVSSVQCSYMDVPSWLTKASGNKRTQPDSEFIALPLTRPELLVLLSCLITVCRSEHTSASDKQLLGSISGRLLRWAERKALGGMLE
jgi:hypothetical protein